MTVPPLLPELTAAVDALVAADPRSTPAAWRLTEIEELLTLTDRLRAAAIERLHVVDADDTTVDDCGRSTRGWLVEEQRLDPREASRSVRLARALPQCTRVREAFRAGRIGFDHGVAITNALAAVPEEFRDTVETALVEMAEDVPPRDLGGAVERLLVACGVEPSSDAAAARRYERRGLTIAATFDGMRSVSGLLSPEVGEALQIAIAAASTAAEGDDRTHSQRRHDGLGRIADHFLATADLPVVHNERPRIVVTIDYDALVAGLDRTGLLPSGASISPAAARRLACDAEIIPAVLGSKGDVLDVGVASRSFSTAVRRAAWLEQQGRCAYPRCRARPVDCHHIIWWVHGGPSTLDNAAWMCAFHHWLVHERGWTMHRRPDRAFTFTGPDGRYVGGSSPPRHPVVA